MTVQELIDALGKVEDKTKTVKIEGCDCINPARSIEENALSASVLIEAAL